MSERYSMDCAPDGDSGARHVYPRGGPPIEWEECDFTNAPSISAEQLEEWIEGLNAVIRALEGWVLTMREKNEP